MVAVSAVLTAVQRSVQLVALGEQFESAAMLQVMDKERSSTISMSAGARVVPPVVVSQVPALPADPAAPEAPPLAEPVVPETPTVLIVVPVLPPAPAEPDAPPLVLVVISVLTPVPPPMPLEAPTYVSNRFDPTASPSLRCGSPVERFRRRGPAPGTPHSRLGRGRFCALFGLGAQTGRSSGVMPPFLWVGEEIPYETLQLSSGLAGLAKRLP